MSGPSELAIWSGALLDASVKGGLLLGTTWLASRLPIALPSSVRHRVWAGALTSLPMLALLGVHRGPPIAIDTGWTPVGLMLLGTLALAVRWGWRWQGLRGLQRRCRLRTLHGVRLGYSERLTSPVTFGGARPVILLPEEARAWAATGVRAALLHELAHIRRGDWWVQLGTEAICALFWFHPLVWLARRELAREAEHAADDQVLLRGVRPTDYAALLVQLASRPSSTVALAAAPSELGRRVHALLQDRPRHPSRPLTTSATGAVCLMATLLLGGWSLWTASPEELTCQPEISP